MWNRWKIAQSKELDCWVGNKDKIQSAKYQAAKLKFWQGTLESCGLDPDSADIKTKKVLDVGCGPAGSFILIDKNPDYWCVDPLMDSYLEQFPQIKQHEVKFFNQKLEDFRTDRRFDIILGFNCLDHVDNLSAAMDKIKELSHPSTQIIISLNVHNYNWLQKILARFSPILDRLHKYQYTSQQYKSMLVDKGFCLIKEFSADSLWKELEDSLADFNVSHKSFWNYLRFSPGKWFFGLLGLLGIAREGYQNPGNPSVYSVRCFILKPNED